MKTTSRTAIAAAATLLVGGLVMSPAQVRAADLGGDCCADLEERVAELEATTVKHGNRKVSLTISGWVNASILIWKDDGVNETGDAYVLNNDTSRSRINFAGSGNIRDDLTAGYRLQIRPWGDVVSGADQLNHRFDRNGIAVRNVYVYLDSKRLGKVQLGLQDSAADGAWYSDLGGSTTWIANYNPEGWFGSFRLRDNQGNLSSLLWGDVLLEQSDGQEGRIAYYSPDMHGLSFAASWGGDDTTAIAGYYNATHGTVSVSGGIGYDVSHADDMNHQCFFFGLACPGNVSQDHLKKFAVSGSIYESGSGLFGALTYAQTFSDIDGRNDPVTWYLKGGWRKNVTGMGETALYAEYSPTQDGPGNDIDANIFGVGMTQDIDAVGGTMYIGYRHGSLQDDVACGGAVNCTANEGGADGTFVPEQDFDAVLMGYVQQF